MRGDRGYASPDCGNAAPWDGRAVGRKDLLNSATISLASALVGIALDRGCLSGVDRKLMVLPDDPDLVPVVTADPYIKWRRSVAA